MNMDQDYDNTANHPEAQNVLDLSSTDTPRVSVQCEDNPEGLNGLVVYDNISYSLPWLNNINVQEFEYQEEAINLLDLFLQILLEFLVHVQDGRIVFDII